MSEHNVREGDVPRKSIFTPESAVMGLLVSVIAWMGLQIFTISDVQATLVTQQKENDRVNEIVYESIPDIRDAILTISHNQQYQSDRMDGLFTVVSNMNESIRDPTKQPNAANNTLILRYGKAPTTE